MKTKITENNYKSVVLKRAIIVCWVLLGICFLTKLIGGNFFGIICNNKNFIKFCDFIDKIYISYIIYYASFLLSSYCLVIITSPKIKFKSKTTIIYLIVCSIIWIFKLLIDLDIINLTTTILAIMDFIILYILLVVFTKKYLKSIFSVSLLLIFTLISVFVKNIGYNGVITDNYLISSIFLIDYYIMLILSSLYSKIIYLRRVK